jgi:hypothetical protein
MNRKILFKFSFLILFSFLVCGCWGVDGNFKKTRNEVFKALSSEDIKKEFEYSFGGFEIYLASKAASLSDRSFDLEMLLDKISEVQVGVYNVEGVGILTSEVFNPFEERMKNKGWTRLLKIYDHNEKSFVYVNIEDAERIRDVFVLSFETNQLVMVEVHGNLDKIVEQVIKKRGI